MSSVISEILKRHVNKRKKEFPGLSTVWLAKKLNVSQVYISQILSGKRALPNFMIEPLAQLLDLDSETEDRLRSEVLKSQGWTKPQVKSLLGTNVSPEVQNLPWDSLPAKDLGVVLTPLLISVLEATSLVDYDGTVFFVAQKLSISEIEAKKAFQILESAGYLVMTESGLRKASRYLEVQSKMKKAEIVSFHTDVLERAKNEMRERQSEEDKAARLITTSVFTCSKDQIPQLRLRLAELMNEISSQAAQQTPEEVYHFGIMLFPASVSDKKTKNLK